MPDPPRITHLERVRIAVEAQIPIVRALQEELGTARASEIVAKALAANTKARVERELAGKSFDEMPFNEAALAATFAAGNALEYEILREDAEAFDFNVTRCRYKQLMEELGALDLGPLLICNGDFPSADAWGLDLERTQTCMQGASHCDFRYRVRRK